MPATKRTSVIATNMRLDRALHRQIKAAARRSLRSMSNEIEERLRRSFE